MTDDRQDIQKNIHAKLNAEQLNLLRRLVGGETIGMPSAYFEALACLGLVELRGAWVATVEGRKLVEYVDQAPAGNWSAEGEVPLSPEVGFVIKDGVAKKGEVYVDREKGLIFKNGRVVKEKGVTNPAPDIGESKVILSWDEAGILQSIAQGKYVRMRKKWEAADVNREVCLLTSLNRLGLIEPDETGIDWQLTPAGKVFLATNPPVSKRVRGTEGWFKITFTDPDGMVSEHEGPLEAGSAVQIIDPEGDALTVLRTSPDRGTVMVIAKLYEGPTLGE